MESFLPNTLDLIAILVFLGLAPFIAIMVTSYVKIVVVLSLQWAPSAGDSPRPPRIVAQPISTAPATNDQLQEPFDSALYFDNLASALPNQLPTVDQLSQIDSPVVSKMPVDASGGRRATATATPGMALLSLRVMV